MLIGAKGTLKGIHDGREQMNARFTRSQPNSIIPKTPASSMNAIDAQTPKYKKKNLPVVGKRSPVPTSSIGIPVATPPKLRTYSLTKSGRGGGNQGC